jgi:hypothetical protein
VDVVGDGAHAAGPLGLVDGDVALAVAGALPPALVEVDVLVPGLRQSGRDERVDLRLDHVVVDLRGEGVPRGPAHRRRGHRDLIRRHRDRFRPVQFGGLLVLVLVLVLVLEADQGAGGHREHRSPDEDGSAQALCSGGETLKGHAGSFRGIPIETLKLGRHVEQCTDFRTGLAEARVPVARKSTDRSGFSEGPWWYGTTATHRRAASTSPG